MYREVFERLCLDRTRALFPWLSWLVDIVKRDLETLGDLDYAPRASFVRETSCEQFVLTVEARRRDKFFKVQYDDLVGDVHLTMCS